jgi:hypothetical protein
MNVAAIDPFDWLLSRPQLLFLFGAGAIWLVKVINRARGDARAPEPGTQPPSLAGSEGRDPDDEERARRVREDILRRIAERRAVVAPPQVAGARKARPMPAVPAATAAVAPASRGSAIGAVAVVPAAVMPPPGGPPPAPQAAPTAGSAWLDELRSRDTARRAILVREILGPPVALR